MSFKRSEDVWFNAETIALECEGTVFRVIRGILSKASPIFADLFTLPQRQDVETFEGVPLVHMPDSEQDMRYFLSAIHDASFYVPVMDTAIDPAITISIARLSTKYEVSFLRKRATDHLAALYPSTLWQYRPTYLARWNSFEVANLAREIDFPSVLPAALYQCAISSVKDILEGSWKHEGLHVNHKLSPDNLAPVLEGRSRLAGYDVGDIYCVFEGWADIPNCPSNQTCRLAAESKLQWHRQRIRDGWSCDPLDVRRFDDLENGLCDECHETTMENIEYARRKIWEKLPEIFELPSWNELNQHKDASQ